MSTLEKIRAEIDEQTEIHSDGEFYIKNIDVKRILAKYAEQEPTDNMPCITPEEMQKCKDIVKKYTPEQEPCDDVVSRQAVLDLLVKYDDYMEFDVYSEIFDSIDKLPPVRPQEQTGHWIMNRQLERRTCDNCNTEYRWSFYPHNFCPNCGARMESEDKE